MGDDLFGYDRLLEEARNIFRKHGFMQTDNDWQDFLSRLSENRKRLGDLIYFYQHTVQPESESDLIRDEVRLVCIFSCIENMMLDDKYQTFFEFIESAKGSYVGSFVDDYDKAKNDYLEKFGSMRNVGKYFEKYLNENDKQRLKSAIQLVDGDGSKEVGLVDISKILYDVRSKFAHGAMINTFHLPDNCIAWKSQGRLYIIKVSIKEFISIFERSFILFWEAKASHRE